MPPYSKTIADMQASVRRLETEAKEIRDRAQVQKRDLTDTESKRGAEILETLEILDSEIAAWNRSGAPAIARPATEARSVEGKGYVTARGQLRHEATYRPDFNRNAGQSYLRDIYAARVEMDSEARERLNRNNREALDYWGDEFRDMGNASTTGGEFVPPLYLGDLWVEPGTGGRPLWDALPKYPMPERGTAVSIPKISSGVTVAARADLGAVSETDAVTANISATVNEYAGLVDVGRILVMRSDPGFDAVMGQMLFKRYQQKVDTEAFTGSGSAPHNLGLDNASLNSVSYTDGSPTGLELLPKLYQAMSAIYDARAGETQPDLIVMAPRRAAWLSYQAGSTFPLAQQGQLNHAFGTQDGGFMTAFAGMKVVLDPNITTTAGAGTNEDKIYILASEDFLVSEGPLYTRVFPDVGSANGTIRYELFGFSATLFARYPTGGTIVSGTGLATPTWT